MEARSDRALQEEYVRSGKEFYMRKIGNELYMVFIETLGKI